MTVQMPGRPVFENSTDQAEDGARQYMTSVSGETRMGFFGVVIVRWEGGIVGDPLPGTMAMVRSIFERADLERERSTRLAVNGFYGREDTGTNDRGAFVVLRQYVGADRVVLAIAVVPGENREALAVAHHFMESVTLDPRYALFAPAGSRRSGGGWTPLYLPESDFGIRMPVAPRVQEREMRVAGQRAAVSTFQSRDGWGTYRVRVIRFTESVPDGAVEEVRRRLHLDHRVRPVESSGFPGYVYTTDVGDQRTWARVFRTEVRIYVVQAQGPRSALRDRAVQLRLLHYFDSFRIL